MLVPGVKLAVVSNFDTRLRSILEDLGLVDLFDCVVISAEVRAEKPNPVIFEKACSMLGVTAAQSLVLGDDRRQVIYSRPVLPSHAYKGLPLAF